MNTRSFVETTVCNLTDIITNNTANMSEPSSSYANIPPASTLDEVDSLPSSSAGSDTSMSPSEEEELSDAER